MVLQRKILSLSGSIIVSTLLLVSASHAAAQSILPHLSIFGGLSQEQLRKNREDSQKIQACIREKGQEALARMRKMNEDEGRKIQELCEVDKRDEAEAALIKLKHDLAYSEEMKIIMQCKNTVKGTTESVPESVAEEKNKKHVCDTMSQ